MQRVRSAVGGLGFLCVAAAPVTPALAAPEALRVGAVVAQPGPFGNVLQEHRAPFAGEALYVVGTPPVSEEEPLAFVGHVTEDEPK